VAETEVVLELADGFLGRTAPQPVVVLDLGRAGVGKRRCW
jgi:hypothetical protein